MLPNFEFFNHLRAILFFDEEKRAALISAIRDKGYQAQDFDEAFTKLFYKISETDFQLILAPFLRASAIQHLREAQTVYAQTFREQYEAIVAALNNHEEGDASSLDTFFEQQSRAGVYGTDIEAGALAELLDVTFACTLVGDNLCANKNTPYVGYRPERVNAPIVHLYNTPGDHFFVEEGFYQSTLGDGNCLYNGFAQNLRQLVLVQSQEAVNLYIEQEQIYSKIKETKALPVDQLISRIHTQHTSSSDQQALRSAIQVASDFRKNTQSNLLSSQKAYSPQEQKLLEQLKTLKNQAISLKERNHQDAAEKTIILAETLKDKADKFFTLNPDSQKCQFATFQMEFTHTLNEAKKWATNHRGYKQLAINMLQTITVIGALLGALKWSITGQYSLFHCPTKTETLIDHTNEILTQLQSS